MPRRAINPFQEGTDEAQRYDEAKAEAARRRQELADRNERNITVQVSKEAIDAAKALGTIAGLPYRQVLGNAAQAGIVTLVEQVQERLNPERPL